MKEKIEEVRERIADLLDEIKFPALGGIVGSFIGMAIAKLIGIL